MVNKYKRTRKIYKAEDWATRTSLKSRVELGCFGRVSSSSSTSVGCRSTRIMEYMVREHKKTWNTLYMWQVYFLFWARVNTQARKVSSHVYYEKKVMVTNSTNINKKILTEHKKDHDIWRWKSRPWLGTGTIMWQG